MSPIKSNHGQYLTDINRENKMKKIMVELADGTCGTISHDFLLEQLVGFITTVWLPDENGTPIKVVGKIVDVLE